MQYLIRYRINHKNSDFLTTGKRTPADQSTPASLRRPAQGIEMETVTGEPPGLRRSIGKYGVYRTQQTYPENENP